MRILERKGEWKKGREGKKEGERERRKEGGREGGKEISPFSHC